MKFLVGILISFFIIMSLGIAAILGIGFYLHNFAAADEQTPLDFLGDYAKFEVRVGLDRTQGRYATYHYEF